MLSSPGVPSDTSTCPSGTASALIWNVPAYNFTYSTYKFCYAWFNFQTNFQIANVTEASGSALLINAVVLPNLTKWTFNYDSYLSLTSVTFPTGGSITYTWQNSIYATRSRYLVSRVVNDGSGAHTWTYAWMATGVSLNVVTDPNNNDTVITQAVVPGYVGQSQYYSGSHSNGTLLKTVATQYSWSTDPLVATYSLPGSGANNVVPTSTTVTWANGQTSQTTRAYDSGFQYSIYNADETTSYYNAYYGLITNQTVSDYGQNQPGNVLQQTSTNYQWQNNSSYLANNLLSLVSSVQLNDGGGTKRAYTFYGYDESSLQSSGVAEQKVAGESYPGNQTSVHRWLNGSATGSTLCSTVTGGYLVTTKAYYDTGEVPTVTDPCGYQTTYQYSGSYYGALVTKVTKALGQNMSYGYDYNSGAVTSITDWNSQITTKSYDMLTRLLSASYPDGGSTTYCYTDGVPTACPSGNAGNAPFAVVVQKAITPSINEISTVTIDGLGRASQTQLNSDPSGTTYMLTTYDALGRKSQVYNPTRCSSITTNCNSETTWGVATTNYDPLNRVTSVVEQDGSTVRTNYSAFPCTTVTDEAGNSRQSCVDGLGRMISVLEDPGSSPHLNYQTTYQYDTLGDLTNVTQNGSNSANARNRSFAYDSLSHLTSATNPESGTILYAYDADSNVITKTAPLPNQTLSATVTTTNTYDKLNRLIKKTYMDGNNSDPYTATAQYGYDGVALSGCPIAPPGDTDSYPVGRATAMCDGSGGTSWIHDTMGRVKQERRAIGATSVNHYIDYTFNLDGSLGVLQTPPMKNLNYTYNGAGQVIKLIDSTDNINFALSATYAPPGELATATLGSASGFTGFTVTNSYNDRLQPILLSATNSATGAAVFSECFDLHLGVAITSPSPCNFNASTAGDNGNVYQITNNRDSTHGRDQNFIYDSLNRIQQAYSSGSGSLSWGETYSPTATSPGVAPTTPGIDAWGNLTNRSGVTGKTFSESLSCPANTNNQLTTCSMSYDAAGNMTSNGSTSYVYDAENRLVWTNGTPASRYIYDGKGERDHGLPHQRHHGNALLARHGERHAGRDRSRRQRPGRVPVLQRPKDRAP